MVSTPTPRPVYLDCDLGVDDSLALGYLLGSPEVDLVGIGTVSGNTSAEQAARNVLDMLGLAGRHEVPVAVGAHDYLTHPFEAGPAHIHGANGVGNHALPAVDAEPLADIDAAQLLIDLSHRHVGELEVITVGPMTNLATAIRRDPTLPARLRAVTAMGGSARAGGNLSPVAEANIGNDPEAAQECVDALRAITFVGLDVTMSDTFEESDRQRLAASDRPFARAIGAMLDVYFDFHVPQFGRRCSALHDPLAAALAVGVLHPARRVTVPLVIDTSQGPGRGQTIYDLRPGSADAEGATATIVLEVERSLADHLVDRILQVG